MNAYQRKRNWAAMLALCAALAAAPVAATAMETTPLVPGTQSAQLEQARMPVLTRQRGWAGVSASSEWLRQARVGGMSIGLRVHTLMGEEIAFQECLREKENGALCLYLMAEREGEGLVLQTNQHALDVLARVGVSEITVGNFDRAVRGSYTVAQLNAARDVLGLTDGELLCVSGDDDPVTVVSEDGVRRMIHP